jgi:hypothetical protein
MSKFKLVLVVLIVAAISSAVGFWFNQNPPGACAHADEMQIAKRL